MKLIYLLLLSLPSLLLSQDLNGVQLFNPKTNDETPVIAFGESLILKFDDFQNSSAAYRYTIRHRDRNWQDDGLFFTEYATGSMNGIIDQFSYSFNTLQKYTHYELTFPNEKLRPKISGNYELLVYQNNPEKPLIVKQFSVTENAAEVGVQVTRTADSRQPDLNQRIQVKASGSNNILNDNLNSTTLSIIQNNNWQNSLAGVKPSSAMGNSVIFQQPNLSFAGNNEFYYFDNKNINQAVDMVAGTEVINDVNFTYLHPVWASPLDYQFQPDVNGAYYFRRNDLGIERDAGREGDYSWVVFSLESEPTDKAIYVLGTFNDYKADAKSMMVYNAEARRYVTKIYLKQGFYNYILATKNTDGTLNYGEINGNFWQTENLYQAYIYYRPFGRNYDGLLSYGEFRTPVR